MSLQKLISRYAAFNTWANTRIIHWLEQVEPALLQSKTSSSFSTLTETLQHIYMAQKFWHCFVLGQEVRHFHWQMPTDKPSEVMAAVTQLSHQMQADFQAFSEVELQETLHLEMPWAKNSLSRYEYILHVINHSTFHRGQLVTMGRSLGITRAIPNTDYNIFQSEI